ncbi:MAG: hypothetical protein LBU47_07065 [Christensenellaceae bacterium]|jgi:hypothetical protein|nr:hypothetical protein [Christensenellaceae bacterium]
MAKLPGYAFFPRALIALLRFFSCFRERVRAEGVLFCAKPRVFVGRHFNNYGPVAMYLHMPVNFRLWAFGAFMQSKSCYRHLREYTFTQRKRFPAPIAALFAFLLCGPTAALLKGLRCIPVHRMSKRVLETIDCSVQALQNGENIMILVDKDYRNTQREVGELYSGVAALARRYFRATGEALEFAPVILSRAEHRLRIGESLTLDIEKPFAEGKAALMRGLQAALSQSY